MPFLRGRSDNAETQIDARRIHIRRAQRDVERRIFIGGNTLCVGNRRIIDGKYLQRRHGAAALFAIADGKDRACDWLMLGVSLRLW